MKIHHLGIVVTDVAETLQALGLEETAIRETVYDPFQKNKLHFIYLKENDLWLELVEPTNETASTHKFQILNYVTYHSQVKSQPVAAEGIEAVSRSSGVIQFPKVSRVLVVVQN